ncbi:chromatin modification- protein VID21, partial [Mortierella sp. AD094]
MAEVNKTLPDILKMRLQSEKAHQEQIDEILVRRDFLLKQFFYMKQLAGTEASLEPEQDFTKIDIEKLKAFQEEHRISESNPTSGILETDQEDISMEEPESLVKQESTTPTVMTPSESAVVVPDLSSDSPMEIVESEHLDTKEMNEKEKAIKKEPTPSIPDFSSDRNATQGDSPPSPKSRAASPESHLSTHLDRQMTPEPRTPGSTPGSTPGAQSNSAETSPSRKLKRMLPPPERMVTRGVSGAIRHRSVDEILGAASERSPTTPGGRHSQQDRFSPIATSPGGSSTVAATSSPSFISDAWSVAINNSFNPNLATNTAFSASSKPPALKLNSTKKHAQPTTTPTAMKRSESRYGSSRYDPMDGMPSSGRPIRHVDLYAWQLKAQSQPIYKALQTASKVLTTKDWKVAREELKLMRAMQRIEALKAGNRWSFKQIKKHRGPARTKTHWDHLLDEMKWIQVDFKEERRWKIATAYQVSRWVMAWHEADDKSLVCVSRRKVTEALEKRPSSPQEQSLQVMGTTLKIEDFVDENMMAASAPVQEETATTAVNAITKQEKEIPTESPIKIETEDIVMSAPTDVSSEQTLNDGPTKLTTSEIMQISTETADIDNKALVSKFKESAKDDFIMMPPPIAPAVLQKCRPLILELDTSTTVFSLDSLESLMEGVHLGSFDVGALFPDLPIYGPPNPEDNDAYVDEAEHGRVTMISRLMSSKPPVLEFGPLASQIVYVKRKREPIAEVDGFDEEDARVPRIEGKVLNAIPGTDPPRTVPVLFQTKKNKDAPMTPIRRPTPPGPLAQKNSILWTNEEDDLLMSLIKPYQFNWDLISDLFNSMRGPIISSERRTSWDCYEKWAKKELPLSGGSSSTSSDASSSLIPIGSLPAGSGSTPSSPKARKDKDGKKIVAAIKTDPVRKKQRSLSLLEAMKKASKKREIAQNRVNSAPVVAAAAANKKAALGQDGQSPKIGGTVPLTPADLSKFKSDRDRHLSQVINEQRQMQAASLALGRPVVRPPMPNAVGTPLDAAQQLARPAVTAQVAAQQRGPMSPQAKAGV